MIKHILRNPFISFVLLSYLLLILAWVFNAHYDGGGLSSLIFFAAYLTASFRIFVSDFVSFSYFQDFSPYFQDVAYLVIEICVALLLDLIVRRLYRKIIQLKNQCSTRE